MILVEEEGNKGGTKTDYQVKRADYEKVLCPNGEWKSTKETVLISYKKIPLTFHAAQ